MNFLTFASKLSLLALLTASTSVSVGCVVTAEDVAPEDSELADHGVASDDSDIHEDEDPGDPLETGPESAIAPEEPPAAPNPKPGPASVITVASWNANFHNDVATVVNHIEKIDADVLGLQEMGSKAHAGKIVAKVTCEACEYAAYHPQKANAHACPIIWKKNKFKRVDGDSFKVNDAQFIKDGGERQNLLDKSTVWVELEHRGTGARFFVSNNHLVPSVEKNGKPFPNRKARLELFDQHMDGIVKTIKKADASGRPIFVTGDFNVNYRRDREVRAEIFPYDRFKEQGVLSNWSFLGAPGEGTHGNRLIDYVFVSKSKKVEPRTHQILGNGGSDHHAVIMKVRLYR